MFYDTLKRVCSMNNTTVSGLVKELGLSTSKVTAWKNGTIPKGDILAKIADYFKVSVDYLLGRTSIPFTIKESANHRKLIYETPLSSEIGPHVIAYLDILGTKDRLKLNENECIENICAIHKMIMGMHSNSQMEKDFELTPSSLKCNVFSDNFIIAIKCDSEEKIGMLAYKLSLIVSWLQFKIFANYGYLTRGAIDYGNLFIDDNSVIGSSLVSAYSLESTNAKVPRVIISPEVSFNIKCFIGNDKILNYTYDADLTEHMFYPNFAYYIDINSDIIRVNNLIEEYKKEYSDDISVFKKYLWLKYKFESQMLKKIECAAKNQELRFHLSSISDYINRVQNNSSLMSLDIDATVSKIFTPISVASRDGGVEEIDISSTNVQDTMGKLPNIEQNIKPLDED